MTLTCVATCIESKNSKNKTRMSSRRSERVLGPPKIMTRFIFNTIPSVTHARLSGLNLFGACHRFALRNKQAEQTKEKKLVCLFTITMLTQLVFLWLLPTLLIVKLTKAFFYKKKKHRSRNKELNASFDIVRPRDLNKALFDNLSPIACNFHWIIE